MFAMSRPRPSASKRALRRLLACAATALVAASTPSSPSAAAAVDPVSAARAKAQDGRYDEAIAGYRAILAAEPRNSDARAGLVDVFVWSGQLDLADRELDIGLAYDRSSPALMARRARVLHVRGDVALGRGYLARAESAHPHDRDLQALGDRMWLGEGRLRMRNDFFPPGRDDLPTVELSVHQRVGRLLVGARSE